MIMARACSTAFARIERGYPYCSLLALFAGLVAVLPGRGGCLARPPATFSRDCSGVCGLHAAGTAPVMTRPTTEVDPVGLPGRRGRCGREGGDYEREGAAPGEEHPRRSCAPVWRETETAKPNLILQRRQSERAARRWQPNFASPALATDSIA
jgi:hypothetical protein